MLNVFLNRVFIGTMCVNCILFYKIREDYKESNLKREIYSNIKNGDYKYLG